MKKTIIFLFLVLLFTILGSFISNRMNKNEYTYVIIKINPEIELVVDKKEKVMEIITLNDDADLLVSDLDLINKTLEEVTSILIDEAIQIGKLENLIELTIMNKNEEKRLEIQNRLREKLELYIRIKNYNAILTVKSITEEIKTNAIEYKISNGHMLLIKKALELNPKLNEEELVKNSIKEIQKEIKRMSVKRREKEKRSKEEIVQEKQQLKEKTN